MAGRAGQEPGRRHLTLAVGLVLLVAACGREGVTRVSPAAWQRVDRSAFGPGAPTSSVVAVVGAGDGLPWLAAGSVADGSGRHRAVVWSSPDARTWARVALAGDSPVPSAASTAARRGQVAVVSGSVGTAAGDRDAAVWSSPDGTAWHNVDSADFAGPGDQEVSALAAGPLGFVAVGSSRPRPGVGADPVVWASPDGNSWRRVSGGAGSPFAPRPGDPRRRRGPGRGGRRRHPGHRQRRRRIAWFSSDGVAWQRATLDAAAATGPDEQVLRSVTAGPSGFVAVGHDRRSGEMVPAVWLSSDGRSWSPAPPAPTSATGPDSATTSASPSHGCPGRARSSPPAASSATFQVWSSADERRWARQDTPAFRAVDQYNPSVPVAAAKADLVVAVPGPPRPELWLRPANGRWVDVSTDETAFPPGTRSVIGSAVARLSSGGLVAMTDDDDVGRADDTLVWTSGDGRRWHKEPTDPILQRGRIDSLRPWHGGLVGGGTYLGGTEPGAQAAVWTTTDGRSWQPSTSFPGAPGGEYIQQVTDVADAGAGLVAVGLTFSPENGINAHAWLSTDGQTWDRATEPGEWSGPGDQLLQSVCRTPAGMVALGSTRVGDDRHLWAWTTTDGHSWTRASGPAAGPLADRAGGIGGCVPDGAGVVAAGSVDGDQGSDAAAWSSPDGRSWHRLDDPQGAGGWRKPVRPGRRRRRTASGGCG